MGYLAALALLAERHPRVFRERRLTPLVGGLGEYLNGGGTDRLPSRQRLLHTALRRYMGPQQIGGSGLMHSRLSLA
jgi:hypothetical protein